MDPRSLTEREDYWITLRSKAPMGLNMEDGYLHLVFVYRQVFIWKLDRTYMDNPQSEMIFANSI